MSVEISEKEIVVRMTPYLIAKMIKRETGEDVSLKTHWFQAICEQTTELPPYSLVTFKAMKR